MFDCTRVGTPEPVSEQKVLDRFDEIHWEYNPNGHQYNVRKTTLWTARLIRGRASTLACARVL